MRGPKIVLIGAGSMFFGRQFIWSVVHSEALSKGTISLVDTDKTCLDKMMKLARMAIESIGTDTKLEGSCDYREVLKGADFVILSFSNKGIYYRGVDCEISLKHGVRMCSGDTIGPGGIFRAMRELPVILDIAKDVEKTCPDAWVINYINPVAINGLGLARYSKAKSFALCDTHHMPRVKEKYLNLTGIKNADIDKFDMTIAGVNHFNWLLDARYDGEDVMELIAERIRELSMREGTDSDSKTSYNNTYTYMLWDLFGKIPTNIAHTKEYVPFWQNKSVSEEKPASLSIFDANSRQKQKNGMWDEIDKYISGESSMDEFHSRYKSDHAVDVIETMWTGNGKQFHINTFNRDAVSNLPADAFLELLCDIDMNGPRPRKAGEFPLGLRAMQMQVIDAHDLTVEAIVHQDRRLLRRAFMTDPIVNSISDADAIIHDLFEIEKEALPDGWYK